MISQTLYVSDLDGTLLNDRAEVSAVSVGLLNAAIERGAQFTVATARTAATVAPLLDRLDMRLPAVVMTGAARWNFDTRKYSHCRFILPERVQLILNLFSRYEIVPFVYTLPTDSDSRRLRVFYGSDSPSAVDSNFIEQRKNLPLKELMVGRQPEETLCDRVLLFFASGNKTVLNTLAMRIKELTPCSVSCYDDIYNPGTGLIEIFAAGVSKAHAISQLREDLNISRLITFGDNLNDIPMFRVADVSVAVENASEAVKEAADIVIGPNTADSVARYIEHACSK